MEQPPNTSTLFQLANKARRLYWRTFNPHCYGVKGLVIHPEDPGSFLAIRQSYGATRPLTLPGGGYRPEKEDAEQAMRREVRQETSLELADEMLSLDGTVSRLEGKIDHISYFAATALTSNFTLNREVAEADWVPLSLEGLDPTDVSSHVFRAVQSYRSQQSHS